MSRIHDLRMKRGELLTWCGISPEDLAAALRVIAETPEIADKRILHCVVRKPGNLLLVETGEGHGGCMGSGYWVLMEKDDTSWKVAEVTVWRS
jgi:hypothetical protein